ncbi:hypothetical protein HB364_19760 [Pseudoflavitalea sp. X16]|uniref:hypothetical protein n=1 Tax=Paraflavitalea devenefica TaxID=2716334 RepID=UPI001422921B|nr:hypothetical protein [Paraflavitalea devenefica]NII27336.1 hypothetical protein [Paraflavitalea devenefica]
MEDYIINVGQIEELQTINDTNSLDTIFQRAKRTIVGGGIVALVRQQRSGQTDRFEEFSTPEDLEAYKKNVYKYLTT